MKWSIILLFILGSWTVKAQSVEKFEALLIINFVKYIEWPSETIEIGILGNSKVLSELNVFIERGGYDFKVEKIGYIEEVSRYDLVFVPKAQSRSIDDIIRQSRNSNTVLVAEDSDLAAKVTFSFFLEGNKLRFTFNEELAARRNIKVGDKIVQFAKQIE